MITLDGSQGEGGGQILRSALALSLVTGRPFRINRIRARRPKPGLMRQHLACVDAATRIGAAVAEGAGLGSTELTFQPGAVVPGTYEFKIGSAGSAMLLLQTILPPLLRAKQPSELVLEGGTHNPFAPPFPFIAQAFLPLLKRLGFRVEATLDRAGFYPNGGGRCRVLIQPATELVPLALAARAKGPMDWLAKICVVGLPRVVGERERAVVAERLAIPADRIEIEPCTEALGPGNTVHVIAPLDGYAEVFTGFGAPRLASERVAEEAVGPAQEFFASGAAVGEHLADQLLLPLALARGGSFVTTIPSGHTRTNAAIIQEFISINLAMTPLDSEQWRVDVSGGNII